MSERAVASATRGIARPVIVSAFLFMAVTGIAYPLATTGAAGILFPRQAGGSLIERDGQVVGSSHIGQHFTSPAYFHGRPSMTTGPSPDDPSKTVDQPYNAGSSAASNQGVISRKLLDAVAARAEAYRAENSLSPETPVPVDAVTASGSGLDPHISVANARLQTARVAAARGMSLDAVAALVARHVAGRQLDVLGDPRVNVLELNLALDAAAGARPAAQ